jgi:crotonobetainyl-CoA:carnitine CoA-transferase CaiB-like acyl-CoA transferase
VKRCPICGAANYACGEQVQAVAPFGLLVEPTYTPEQIAAHDQRMARLARRRARLRAPEVQALLTPPETK